MSLGLTTKNHAAKRRELDFYPTPANVTQALLNFLMIPKPSTIWEPACGDGAMVKVLRAAGHRVIDTDIQQGTDYLETMPLSRLDAIITNPPFNQSEAFIKKALTEAPIVCMLLKSQYWRAKKRIYFFDQTKPTYVLPLSWRPDFMNKERGGRPTMEVAWTVWLEGNTNFCKYIILPKPK